MRFGSKIRLLLALIVFALAGVTVYLNIRQDETTFHPVPQQDGLARLIVHEGYDISGIPVYDSGAGRWTIVATVPYCKEKLKLGGDPGPQSQSPTSFEVVSLHDSPPPQGARNVRNIAPVELTAFSGVWQALGCN